MVQTHPTSFFCNRPHSHAPKHCFDGTTTVEMVYTTRESCIQNAIYLLRCGRSATVRVLRQARQRAVQTVVSTIKYSNVPIQNEGAAPCCDLLQQSSTSLSIAAAASGLLRARVRPSARLRRRKSVPSVSLIESLSLFTITTVQDIARPFVLQPRNPLPPLFAMICLSLQPQQSTGKNARQETFEVSLIIQLALS